MNLLFDLFHRFPPVKDVYNDAAIADLHAVGGVLISIGFIILGLIILLIPNKTDKSQIALKERRNIAKLISYALIFCGISRGVDVLCIWYNYSYISALLKVFTGIVTFVTIGYVPYIVTVMKKQTTLEEVKHTLITTTEKIEIIKQIGDNINKNV